MKIIKAGKLPDSRPLTGECWYCHAQIECLQSEAGGRSTDPRDGTVTYSYLCPTPGCGRTIILNEQCCRDLP